MLSPLLKESIMKHTPILRTLSLIFTIALAISACGAAPAAIPTMDMAAVQNTAVAAAMTIVAETQAAVPTSTSVPATDIPTQTPLPTDTPVLLVPETPTALPALDTALPTATLVVSAGGNTDPCNTPLTISPHGDPTKIRLLNQTNAPIIASIYLNKTPFGECGFRGYNIGKAGAVTITDLTQACYNVSVFVNDPKKPSRAFGYGCINNSDQWTFIINKDTVSLQGR